MPKVYHHRAEAQHLYDRKDDEVTGWEIKKSRRGMVPRAARRVGVRTDEKLF